MTTILKTDAYELTMLSSFVEDGKADDPAVFELFARKLPSGRRFGIQAGLGRFLEAFKEWTVTEDDISFLESVSVITPKTREWLRAQIGGPLFNGTIRAYREGELYYPNSPILQVEGSVGEGILLETYLLSIYNHDTAVASAAARMSLAAHGRKIIEMGSRRTHDDSAVSAARSAYIAGFSATSNLLAGERYGIPVTGTAAHAYTLAHETEAEAFRAQMKTWGVGTTLLVDTYDTLEGIKTGVKIAQEFGATGPGAIRIDSGDLLIETHVARELLDLLGAVDTKIVVSSDLDEYLMAELEPAPIDGFGAGTRVVTGSGHPTAGMVYKLVEINGRPVAKKSSGKYSVGGKKTPFRVETGEEYFTLDGTVHGEALYHEVVKDGEVTATWSLDEVRDFTMGVLENLPKESKLVEDGTARFVAEPFSQSLVREN